jgi:GcvH upstream region-like protein
MMQFLRNYQRFFLIIITFVIIVSFSFFGTYSAVSTPQSEDIEAFVAVDGSSISQSEVDRMALFLSTDADDKLSLGGLWGPNFLNDGVIRKDLMATGIAQQLITHHRAELTEDLQTRLDKEKYYVPYAHPQAKFLSAEAAWSYFAPDLKSAYDQFKTLNDGASDQAIQARIYLFLAEKRFPHYALRHVLRYQESQYDWVNPDSALAEDDLFLFGHHTVDDWFGRNFVRLAARTVINGAKEAERRGYSVTKAEALADLKQNASDSYRRMEGSNEVILGGVNGYMQEQLRRMGMDNGQAVKIWRQVLLFRRLFHDTGSAVFSDALPYQQFQAYAKESVTVDLYRLPTELRFADFRTLAKFEAYLKAIAPSASQQLQLPTQFVSIDELVKKHPELVQKRYLVELIEADKQQLQSKVSVKETWAWEVDDQHWRELAQKFPDIGAAKGETVEDRYAVLDRLDEKTRAKIDAYARTAIVDQHPEWLEEMLASATPQKLVIAVRPKGGALKINGANDREALIKQLDAVALSTEDGSAKSSMKYSGDGIHHYKITIYQRSPNWEALTFAEANADNTLDLLLDGEMEPYYSKVRDSSHPEFRREDGKWKPYTEVRNDVAKVHLERLIKAVYEDAQQAGEKLLPNAATPEFAASHRFYHYMRGVRDTLSQHPDQVTVLTKQTNDQPESWTLSKPLVDQWKLLRDEQRTERGAADAGSGLAKAFQLKVGTWSDVATPINGDIRFFVLKHRGYEPNSRAVGQKMDEAQYLLGAESQRLLMDQLLSK